MSYCWEVLWGPGWGLGAAESQDLKQQGLGTSRVWDEQPGLKQEPTLWCVVTCVRLGPWKVQDTEQGGGCPLSWTGRPCQ